MSSVQWFMTPAQRSFGILRSLSLACPELVEGKGHYQKTNDS